MRGEFPFAALVPRRSALGALRNTSIAQGTLRDPIVIRPRDARRAHDHFSHTIRGRSCKALPRPPICLCTHTTHALSSHKKQATRCLQYRSTLTHHTSHDHATTAPQLTALHALDQSSRQVYSPPCPPSPLSPLDSLLCSSFLAFASVRRGPTTTTTRDASTMAARSLPPSSLHKEGRARHCPHTRVEVGPRGEMERKQRGRDLLLELLVRVRAWRVRQHTLL